MTHPGHSYRLFFSGSRRRTGESPNCSVAKAIPERRFSEVAGVPCECAWPCESLHSWPQGPHPCSREQLRRHREDSQRALGILTAYRELGSYRAAAALCGTSDKTVKRVVQRREQGPPRPRRLRRRNTAVAADVVREKVAATDGRSRPSTFCPRPARRSTAARRATSAGWSAPRRTSGDVTGGSIAPGCRRRASISPSTGARRERCTSSARCSATIMRKHAPT